MNRRRFLGASLGSIAFAATGASRLVLAQCPPRTPSDIEGPFYLAGAPERQRLVHDPRLFIHGTVRDTRCRPMRDAVMEIWQADEHGEYDVTGPRMRGVLRTDERGAFALETVFPGRYLNGPTYRPRHIHVKVHANGRPSLTTQLYFPRDPFNERDPWMRDALLLRFRPPGCGPRPPRASFDFVV